MKMNNDNHDNNNDSNNDVDNNNNSNNDVDNNNNTSLLRKVKFENSSYNK